MEAARTLTINTLLRLKGKMLLFEAASSNAQSSLPEMSAWGAVTSFKSDANLNGWEREGLQQS